MGAHATWTSLLSVPVPGSNAEPQPTLAEEMSVIGEYPMTRPAMKAATPSGTNILVGFMRFTTPPADQCGRLILAPIRRRHTLIACFG
ncbi:hypothetical protein A5659_03600 [Mycobacterium sp. 1165196.3]|nr:hypothetical protein A5659_03600 [Mycobacterium sp. 1165196.3]